MGKREYHREHDDHLNADLNHLSRNDNTTEWHQSHVPALPTKGGGSGLQKRNRVVTGRNSGRMVKPGQHHALGGISSRLKFKAERSGASSQLHAGHSGQGPLTPGGRPMSGKLAVTIEQHSSKKQMMKDLANLKQKQAANNTLIRSQSHEFKTSIPDYLQSLIDINGDGQVDSEEFALMRELENVEADDINGDGHIDEHEILLAKQLAGKRLLAKKFVDSQNGTMWRYAKEFKRADKEQIVDKIVHAKDYQGLMNHLKLREQVIRLSSSDQVKSAFETPSTNRAKTGRNKIYQQAYFGLR